MGTSKPEQVYLHTMVLGSLITRLIHLEISQVRLKFKSVEILR